MSATDELRRLLDERGVEYETHDEQGASETMWNGFAAYQLTPNAKLIMHPTPEQAVEATLGRGTCRMKPVYASNALECSECGSYVATWDAECDTCSINYCPNCGSKVSE